MNDIFIRPVEVDGHSIKSVNALDGREAHGTPQTFSNDTYICQVEFEGHPHLLVKVPDGRDAHWPIQTFSIKLHSEAGAWKMARQYRDRCVKQSPALPSGLLFSKGPADLDAIALEQIQSLYHLQKSFCQIRVPTLAMLSMFADQPATVVDISDAVSTEPASLRKQIQKLHEKGLLSRGNSVGRYVLSPLGVDLLHTFQNGLGIEPDRPILSRDHYASLFLELKAVAHRLGIGVVVILRA